VEYGDYQCPICGLYYPTIKQVQEKYGDAITFQFRNLPLPQIHQNAFAAARAAEAAGLQNKYWEMHDLLYEGQSSWSSISNPMNYFESYAKQIGLDVNQFRTDFSSSKVNNLINADIAEFAKTKNEQATPTFFLNGTKIDNTKLVDKDSRPDLAKLIAIIDAEIAKQNPAPTQ
jgi:protein-disulfide isomerase